MILFGELVGWGAYHGGKLAESEILEDHFEAVLRRRRNDALARISAKTATEAKALADSDPEVIEAQDALKEARADKRRELSAYTNAKDFAAFVSRELSRRTSRSDIDSRNDRWNP